MTIIRTPFNCLDNYDRRAVEDRELYLIDRATGEIISQPLNDDHYESAHRLMDFINTVMNYHLDSEYEGAILVSPIVWEGYQRAYVSTQYGEPELVLNRFEALRVIYQREQQF